MRCLPRIADLGLQILRITWGCLCTNITEEHKLDTGFMHCRDYPDELLRYLILSIGVKESWT